MEKNIQNIFKRTSFLLVLPLSLLAQHGDKQGRDFELQEKKQGIAFTENKGQVCDQNSTPRPDVLFGAMAGNLAFHLKTNGVSYQLQRVDKWKEVENSKTLAKHKEIDRQTIYRIDLNWLNYNTNFTPSTDEALSSYNNYYLENCPNGALNVKSYKGVTLLHLYKGINLHYYEKGGELKHDYIVAPHSNYKQIQLQVKGATIEINKNGTLLLNTPLGKVEEGAPLVYQNGKQLKAKWVVKNDILSFEIENYNTNAELIIDPLTRLWGTYYGGVVDDFGNSCITDASGNVYLTGLTGSSSATAIATSGSHQTIIGGAGNDAFLVKFNSSGVRLWGTYYGSTASDVAFSCATDALGNVYISGQTNSSATSAISTAGSHQVFIGGNGLLDAFLVKFNSSGVRQWGTYYGGIGDDIGYSCATDASGNVYLAGQTTTTLGTIISTAGSHQSSFAGVGTTDAFLVKFNSFGVRLWGTYYGGLGDDRGFSCCTDATGNVYLTGLSFSGLGTSIASAGSHQSMFGGFADAFLVKFNANGVRQWGTYYGGFAGESGFSCSTDATGSVYMTGRTESTGGATIATVGSHQSTFGGGTSDAFVVKFNGSGTRLWGTYYGGSGVDLGFSSSTDASNNVYLAGSTTSTIGSVIASPGSQQINYGGGSQDGFLVKFNSLGVRQSGTYIGGAGNDLINRCCTDASGSVYLAGQTTSSLGVVIASANSHQSSYGGGTADAFLTKFQDCINLNLTSGISNSASCIGATINFSASITSTVPVTYAWAGPNSFTASIQNPTITNASALNSGIYTVTVNNAGCIATATTQVSLTSPSIIVNSGAICVGSTFTITPSGASTYTFQGGSNVVSPTSTSAYTVSGTSALGCVGNIATSNVTVNPNPTLTVVSSASNFICVGQSASLTASGASTYSWSNTNTGVTISVSPSVTTNYTVTGTDINGCKANAVISQSVSLCTHLNTNALSLISGLTIYPNPSNGVLNIDLETLNENTTITIVNTLGQIVLRHKATNLNLSIPIEHLARGIYYVIADNKTAKLVKD